MTTKGEILEKIEELYKKAVSDNDLELAARLLELALRAME